MAHRTITAILIFTTTYHGHPAREGDTARMAVLRHLRQSIAAINCGQAMPIADRCYNTRNW